MNGESRSSEFTNGAYEVKYPTFHTRQQGVSGVYEPHSVLDYLQATGNGASEFDKSRMFRGGGYLGSLNGKSEQTDARSQWLRNPLLSI